MGEYEDTLGDIESTLGMVPGFMKLFPREALIHDWPSWKRDCLGEIDLERARYLLSADDMCEEMLNQVEITERVKPGNMARTVCCGVLVDTDKAPVAKTITGEQFLVCNDNCKKFVETATPEQISELAAQ